MSTLTLVPDSYRFFTPATAKTFRAVAARILPPDAGSSGGDDARVVQAADEAMAAREAGERRDFHRFLGALETLPRLRYGRSFSRLPPAKQDAVLRFFEHNQIAKLRLGFLGLKIFSLMAYYTDAAHFEEIGYPGPRMDAPFFRASHQPPDAPSRTPTQPPRAGGRDTSEST